MIYKDIETVILKPEALRLSALEVAARLKVKPDYTDPLIEECKSELLCTIAPKFCFCETDVKLKDGVCVFDFGGIKSEGLAENLKGCKRAYLMAATLGLDTDRYIAKCGIMSTTKSFVADGIASAFVEAVCDCADSTLLGKGKHPRRFSAGYGDLSLSYQKTILDRLCASQTVGISLTNGLLMIPQKSVSAILGVKDD